MEWRDDGLILGTRDYGETSVIIEAMTRAHGRHFGLVRGGRSKRLRLMLQPGTSAEFVWRARLDEHLGTFAVEPIKMRIAPIMASAEALHAICLVAALLRLAAERDPHRVLYEKAAEVAEVIGNAAKLAPLLVHFEAEILAEMGFGLDLSCCAATGATEDLVYVSPKSGRAVSRAAGEPYKSRLLPLPGFFLYRSMQDPSLSEVKDGFKLTGFFLMRDLFGPQGAPLPKARVGFLTELEKRLRRTK
jgi:DNA repair protein RecO (recombination protein O)